MKAEENGKKERAVVIGAGAAGMFAAVQLGKRGFSVTVLEKNEKAGKKIFITGKGRCNFTNVCTEEEFFAAVKSNPRFLYSAYRAFSSSDAIRFFEKAGMRVKVERGKRAFPVSDHAYDVTDALKRQMKKYGAELILHAEVLRILTERAENDADECASAGREKKVTGVIYRQGGKEKKLPADRVVIATGGLSYPTTGSTGDGYRFAASLGHTVKPCVPSLVPLEIAEDAPHLMAGLSLKNVRLTVKLDGKNVFSDFGELLFTHKGISGPIALSATAEIAGKLSRSTGEGNKVRDGHSCSAVLDLKPAVSEEEFEARLLRLTGEAPNKNIANILHSVYPSGMIAPLLSYAEVPEETKGNALTREMRRRLVSVTKGWTFTVTGTAGYNEAVVTKGGVSVKEVDPRTMQSKLVGGLYFAGEVLDLDAVTGGFNLQIAWCTGYAAGNA